MVEQDGATRRAAIHIETCRLLNQRQSERRVFSALALFSAASG